MNKYIYRVSDFGREKIFKEATLSLLKMKPINLCGNCIPGIWLVQFTGRAKLTIQNHASGLTPTAWILEQTLTVSYLQVTSFQDCPYIDS